MKIKIDEEEKEENSRIIYQNIDNNKLSKKPCNNTIMLSFLLLFTLSCIS